MLVAEGILKMIPCLQTLLAYFRLLELFLNLDYNNNTYAV